jgi:hypothetical protein
MSDGSIFWGNDNASTDYHNGSSSINIDTTTSACKAQKMQVWSGAALRWQLSGNNSKDTPPDCRSYHTVQGILGWIVEAV